MEKEEEMLEKKNQTMVLLEQVPAEKESKEEQDDKGPGQVDPDHVNVPLAKFEFISVFVSLALAIFLVAIDTTIVSTAIPAIVKEFKALDQIAWIGKKIPRIITISRYDFKNFN
jgi:hypothetical protein